jgi:ribosomal-protein-alanine N-acetyltransferase
MSDSDLVDGPVSLRPLTLTDCTETYLGWLQDPEVNRWLETRWSEQSLATIRAYVKANTTNGCRLWAITVGGRHIGNIKLGLVDVVHQSADVAYFIGERAEWGKGHATRAVKLVVGYAFNHGVHRVQAGAYERNLGSQRVLLKAGFAREGRLHRALKTDNGWADHLLFGRVREQVSL